MPESQTFNEEGMIKDNAPENPMSNGNTDLQASLSSSPENLSVNVYLTDQTQYDPDQQQTDGLSVFHREDTSVGDVCLKLSSRSTETWGVNNQFHSATTVVLNAVSAGLDKADFTIQNEYAGPNLVRETFRIKHNGNVGIGSQNPASKLQISNGDVYIDDINSGIIMKSPDGQCWRVTVGNDGQFISTAITCPN